MASVSFANETAGAPEQFKYLYTYTTSGQVSKQRLALTTGATTVNLDALYGVGY